LILGLETVASRVDWCSARAQSDEHGEQKKELEGLLWRGDLYRHVVDELDNYLGPQTWQSLPPQIVSPTL